MSTEPRSAPGCASCRHVLWQPGADPRCGAEPARRSIYAARASVLDLAAATRQRVRHVPAQPCGPAGRLWRALSAPDT
jgi:hypothetical protein